MSFTSRTVRARMALLLLALALGPSMAWGGWCAMGPQPRAAAHPCCRTSAQACAETARWAPGCCGRPAAPTALAVREVQAQGSPVTAILPVAEVRVPVPEIVSARLLARFAPRRAVPLFTLFSILLI